MYDDSLTTAFALLFLIEISMTQYRCSTVTAQVKLTRVREISVRITTLSQKFVCMVFKTFFGTVILLK
jgi:hypothetical protein